MDMSLLNADRKTGSISTGAGFIEIRGGLADYFLDTA
jgi:hypothetical protein